MFYQEISIKVLREKYAKGDERSIEDVQVRVARALASVEQKPLCWEQPFLDTLRAGFIPAGRILSAAGTGIQATLINSFVEPVGDSLSAPDSNGRPGIYVALREAAETMYRGGGVGYNFSAIRPKGALVRGAASRASGPVSYMRVFDRSCETVESAGARRGAQMGILDCDHPDILKFIDAKDQPGELSHFNISVGVKDDLIQAVVEDRDYELVHHAEPADLIKAAGAFQRMDGRWVYQSIRTRALWDAIIRSTYEQAEPGVVFLDRIATEKISITAS